MKFLQKDWILYQELINEGGNQPDTLKLTNIKEGNPDEIKHVPWIVKTKNGYKVNVGKTGFHANDESHHINIIQLIIDDELIITKNLKFGENPEFEFLAQHGEKVEAFAFCNLHGMWKGTL